MTERASHADPAARARDDAGPAPDALALHRRAILVDMHADTVQRVVDEGANINARLADGHLDAVRAREGGLDAQFFSIWVEPEHFGAGGAAAVERADLQIAAVRALAAERPDVWQQAGSAADIRRIAAEGKIATLMGLEGGYAIDGRIENVEKYFRLGVRYLSPAWTVSLPWAGSSGDDEGAARGLDGFGREVIGEMNRLGMMPDVSHVSDKTFWDMIGASTKPVIASHSNARALVNVPRNLTDDQIRALAAMGGVCSVVFYPRFVEAGWQDAQRRVDAEIAEAADEAERSATGTPSQKRRARERVRAAAFASRLPPVHAARVVDHVDHIARLVGVEHIGVGSDFDGINATPADLSSVADFPNLTIELLRRGYAEADVEKILGGNILRVMEQTHSGP
ncbi:MAG TPA: dipeptidase [Pyrinomonadaceae bacterium]|jgi:membrane dipeptidase